MRRLLWIFAVFLILTPLSVVVAQDTTGTEGEETEEGDVVEQGPEITSLFGEEAETLIINVRSDLELLATTAFQNVTRPEGWNGNLDLNNPQLPLLVRLDLELLAGSTLGADQRPNGWFGAVQSTNFAFARDLRHDIELLADALTGAQRPDGWIGGDPMMKCSRSTQTLVNMLERGGVFDLNLDISAPNFCVLAEIEATRFSEVNLLSTTEGAIFTPTILAAQPGAITVQTDFAVAFLDKNAALRVGVIPNGTSIKPEGRSTSQFSKMALVSGPNFAVFVEYTTTNMTEDQFRALPDSDDASFEPFCAADWCGGG